MEQLNHRFGESSPLGRVQYRLATMLLITLSIAAILSVKSSWSPWVRLNDANLDVPVNPSLRSRDGTRYLMYNGGRVYIMSTNGEVCVLSEYFGIDDKIEKPLAFLDDNTVLCVLKQYDQFDKVERQDVVGYRRRFPEMWWGHFYRPEVWIGIVLCCFWLWYLVKVKT